jgi:hypothetical protein
VIVMTTAADTIVRTAEPRVGRAAVTGGLIGFVVVSTAASLLSVVSGVDVIPAVALGLFVGSWGGLGFGAMLAASITTAMRTES